MKKGFAIGSAIATKAFLALAAVSVLSAGLVSCSKKGGSDSQDNSLSNVKSRNAFVIGLDDSFPPMGYRNENNEIVGFDVDLAREAAKRMSVGFKAQAIDWDAKEMEIASGNIDCIWNGFTITDERKKNLLFSDPYLNNEQVFLVMESSGIRSEAQLTGKKIGMQTGSSGAESYANSSLKGKNIAVEYKDFLIAIMDLRTGGIDALVIDSIVAGAQLRESGVSDELMIIKSSQLPAEQFGVGFRKGDKALRDEVQRHLDEMRKDGTFAKLAEKYEMII
ncbi:MAG TPA: amino acid ABC transporter substrate-binding protein [Spirochaetaceae bacterium]|nr:amino acid ABC transporter substrate-binding protein [Spirochaetaceae bacterium]